MSKRHFSHEHDEEDGEGNDAIYKWEKGIKATWENVKEDEAGNLLPIKNAERERSHLLKKSRVTESVRRGLIRFFVIALDISLSAGEKDYRPSRLEVCKNALQQFIFNYYDQNPISQIGLIYTRDRIAEKLTDLSGNSKNHIHRLQNLFEVKGLASLQNTITISIGVLKHIPNYGSRELLILFNSLSTCDPGNIFETVQIAKSCKIRINIICLSAEIYICKKICEMTNGFYAVAMDAYHLQELLSVLIVPPVDLAALNDPTMNVTDFIYMGFPKRSFETFPFFSYDGKKIALANNAFVCPRCLTRTTDIPVQCSVCSLQLNSSSHIARSFHHLFPVPLFTEYTIYLKPGKSSTTSSSSKKINPGDYFAELYKPGEPIPHLLLTSSDGEENQEQKEEDSSALKIVVGMAKKKKKQQKKNKEPEETEDVPSSPPPPPPPSDSTEIQFDSSPPPPPPPPPPPDSSEEDDDDDEDEQVENDNQPQLSNQNNSNRIPMTKETCRCRGCFQSLLKNEKVAFRCPNCLSFFCLDCDLFIHESLHNCSGCL
jgi:transcription initiation factor TFIIH subunit 2